MNDNEKEQFGVTISGLAEAFGREASGPMLHAYWMGLSDLPMADVTRAATKALRQESFMPPPAKLRELAGVVNHKDLAIEAWAIVDRAAGSIGSYRGVDFEDPIINAAIRSLGGWPALCAKPVDEFNKWTRKEFLATYESLARSEVNGEICDALPGLATSGEVVQKDGSVKYFEAKVEQIAVTYTPPQRRLESSGKRARDTPRLELRKP